MHGACLGTASQHTAKCTDTFEQLINPSVADEVPAVSSSAEEIQRPDDGAAPAQNQQQTTEHSTELPVQQAAGTKREEWRTDQHLRQQRDLTHRLPALSQISPQRDIQMSEEQTPDSAMEINALCEEQIKSARPGGTLRQGWRVLRPPHWRDPGSRRDDSGNQSRTRTDAGVRGCSSGNAAQRNQLARRSSASRCFTRPMVTKYDRELWPDSMLMECLHLNTMQARCRHGL